MRVTQLKGVIFDLDGTLVDSGLDFDRMRGELEIPRGQPILEYVVSLPPGERKSFCVSVLERHEMEGAERATLMPGVATFLSRLHERQLKKGILTRNDRKPTLHTLARLGLNGFHSVVTREDGPVKPDPSGLFRICNEWGCDPSEAIFVGDYVFDLEAGKRAGMKTALYAPMTVPDFAHQADFVFKHFSQLEKIFESQA